MDKKSKNKYVDELTSSICQLSQTLIDEKFIQIKIQNIKMMRCYLMN